VSQRTNLERRIGQLQEKAEQVRRWVATVC
jgi:hypothetical protein